MTSSFRQSQPKSEKLDSPSVSCTILYFFKKINNSELSIRWLRGYLEIGLLLADLMSAPVIKAHLIFGEEARTHYITIL